MLSFAPAPREDWLLVELGKELADYIDWRRRRRRSSRDRAAPSDCALHEVIPYSRIPRGVDLKNQSLNDQLEPAGWHLQIHCGDRPRYYARAGFENDWTVDWIGEAWLANDIADGIHWLDDREGQLPTTSVTLLSSRLFRFSSFIVDGQHFVVSAPRDLRRHLPLFRQMTDRELAGHLLDFYGERYAEGGLQRAG